MDLINLGTMVEKYGVGIVLTLVMVIISILLIKFILKQWDKMLEEGREERVGFQKILDGYLATLKEHSVDALNRYTRTEEANRYQREEHLKMIDGISVVINSMNLTQQSLKNVIESSKSDSLQRQKEAEALARSLKEVADHCIQCGKVLAGLKSH